MEGIKTYQQKLNQLIAETKVKRDIGHLKDEIGAVASWDSKVWVFTKGGQTVNFYFITNTHPGVLTSAYIQAQPTFAKPICDLLMLYILDVFTKKIAIKTMYGRYLSARNLIAPMGMLSDLTPDVSLTYSKSLTSPDLGQLTPFIDWINNKLFGHAYLKIAKRPSPTQTGAEVLANRYDNLPDIKAVMALGAITHDTITGIEQAKWHTTMQDYQRDAYVCVMGTLAMAAPNRVAAEQTVLSAQILQRDRLNREGQKRTIHWLDWIGSKGYANNQKHVLKPMAECVEICLDYVLKATEPMRKLARFYVDPSLPLKRILTEKEVNPQRWQKVSPDPDKPTNMVVLGYLLGFYPETVTSVRVLKGTPGATQKQLDLPKNCSENERFNLLGDSSCFTLV
ncbi:hypothetical protein [Vibrio cyclitrophicus]|uniref:hypothetical protein n=1 Tax=Vibrio cyclitrophicus TaxID=47951 RepID=UPI0011B3F45F|nr:hypothetical protein [Vibrio cyclitrophicus]